MTDNCCGLYQGHPLSGKISCCRSREVAEKRTGPEPPDEIEAAIKRLGDVTEDETAALREELWRAYERGKREAAP